MPEKYTKFLFSLILSFISIVSIAQQLHTPSEVQQYMEKSTIQYNLDSLSVTFDEVSLPIVEKGYYLTANKHGIQLEKKQFPISKKIKGLYKKAHKAKKKNNLPKSIDYYLKALKKAPEHPILIAELANIYWKKDDIENVIFWAKKGIELNPIDFESHTLLAMAYQKINNYELALEHITLAHLYNRNHKKTIEILKSIYMMNGMTYTDFVFFPKYKIESKDSTVVSIQANESPWKSYATCKALWQYEEKYKEGMGHIANTNNETIEQKECLLNALISYERMETGKEDFPEFKILGNSLRNRMVNDFILYEIELRESPLKIYLLPQTKIQRIMRYLISVRVNQEVISE